MSNENDDYVTPDEFNEFVDLVPRKVNLRDYYSGICGLRRKGYSFAEIADMVSDKLGQKITRSQISYLLTTPPEILAEEEEEERQEAMDESAEEFYAPMARKRAKDASGDGENPVSDLGRPKIRADQPPGGKEVAP